MKTLVILAHPNINESKANKRWKEELLKYPQEIEVHELYREYPDWNIDVKREQELLIKCEHIIFQFPLYWFNCPPLLKKWLDEVFEYNWAYGLNGDKLKNKKIGLAVTTGGKREYYKHGGKNKFSLDEILIPFEETIRCMEKLKKENKVQKVSIIINQPIFEKKVLVTIDDKEKEIEVEIAKIFGINNFINFATDLS